MHDKINVNRFAAVEEIDINAVNNPVCQLAVVVDKNNALAQAKRDFEDPPEMKLYHNITSYPFHLSMIFITNNVPKPLRTEIA